MSEDFATDAALRKGLREPFPRELIGTLPATSKRPALDYVNHAVVTDRLNQVAPGWTMSEPQPVTFTGADGLPHCMAVLCSMTIGSVTRWEVGEADGLDNYGRELKGAMSDWIRRVAMRFGVATDLWTKSDLQSVQEPATRTGEVRMTEDMAVATAEGVEQGKVSTPDVAAAMSASFTDQDAPATDEQWERLLTMCDGNRVRAVSRLNRFNKTDYTKETSYGATKGEVAKAIAGA